MPVRRLRCAIAAVCVSTASLTVLLSTSDDYGMVWDEGHTIRREEQLARWFTWLWKPPAGRSRWDAFSQAALARSWPFSREEPDGHPPFYALLGLAGWSATHSFLEPLTAYRVGPMMLYAATVGVLFWYLAMRQGWLAAAAGSGSLVLMPRLFSHAHYAHYDMVVSCLWLLAQMAFVHSLRSRAGMLTFGLLLGLAFGTKFTGMLAAAPSLLWLIWQATCSLLFRTAQLAGPPTSVSQDVAVDAPAGTPGRNLCSITGAMSFGAFGRWVMGVAVAVGVLYLMTPPWWFEPMRGPFRFLESNLSRADTKPIPTWYLANVYPFALPWHNTLVLTAATVPMGMLLVALVGGASVVARRRTEPDLMLWLLSWSVLMVVRALPVAPGHDGVRQFLPSIVGLTVLVGLGAAELARRSRTTTRGRWASRLIVAAVLGEGLAGIVRLYPYTLSYYNAAVGGLAGAERRGFELTYYWDTMSTEFLDWVRERSRRERLELRFPSNLVNVPFLRRWHELPADVSIVGIENTERPYYVLQRRFGVYYPYDWWLDRNGRACFSVKRHGVDLLRVYSYEESLKAYQATRNVPIPPHLRY